MTQQKTHSHHKNTFLHRLAHSRPRLMFALAIGIIISLLLPDDWDHLMRALTGWNAAVWFYLCAMAWMMARASHARVRTISEQQDNSAPVVLTILSVAAVFSLSALVFVLAGVKEMPIHERLLRYGFTALTVGGSWLLVAVMFTFHYAHMFYRSPVDQRSLAFPENETQPDYWDFLYFSFTVAVAAATSDVNIRSRAMRKAVTAQSILSFLFNVAIIGLSINIAAGLVGT